MKYIIAPDSFKGSLSSQDFCKIFDKVLSNYKADSKIISMPLADGGEGTLDCILAALNGEVHEIEVTSAFIGEKCKVKIGFFENGKTAVIESALAMGLPAVGERKNPEITTTYGVGQMIDYAVSNGAKSIILTLGGSSTNDCGAGLLSALGVKFFNKKSKEFIPTGGTLIDIHKIDFSELITKIQNILFTAMCDVNNPLCGKKGCSYVYGPQKGADESMVKRLDQGCNHFAELISKSLAEEPGAGAAGGLGYCCVACLNGKLQSGIQTILDMYDFDMALKDCNYVITGEGCFDEQSLMGKTIGGIISRVKQHNLKEKTKTYVSVFCGKNKCKDFSKYPEIESINEISKDVSIEYSINHAVELLEQSADKWYLSL